MEKQLWAVKVESAAVYYKIALVSIEGSEWARWWAGWAAVLSGITALRRFSESADIFGQMCVGFYWQTSY